MRVDISLPTDIAIKNIGDEITSFRYFGVNFVKKLDIDEEVIISGASSEATAFYLAQADENKALQVKVNETDSSEEETVVEEPVVNEPAEPTPTEPTEPTEPAEVIEPTEPETPNTEEPTE